MNLVVKRFSEIKNFGGSTLGLLYVDGRFECYTLEDEAREVKAPGETRIPEGTYTIILRKFGEQHLKYQKLFPDIHKGMLEISNVPGFTGILIHRGNTEKDTAGCLLVGDGVNNNTVAPALLADSTPAYKRIYGKAIRAILGGEKVTISLAGAPGEGIHGTF
jgi:hypothetical protein